MLQELSSSSMSKLSPSSSLSDKSSKFIYVIVPTLELKPADLKLLQEEEHKSSIIDGEKIFSNRKP